MKILLTNDDGLSAEGIQVLGSILATRHDVWIVAPSENRSGVSHGITMFEPLRFKASGDREFSCSGLPVDCAITGSQGIMPELPDVVVSGINQGANLGTDILYSGTAAAARQASINGLPGIAVSLVSGDGSWYWEPLARFVLENLETLITLCERDIFVNINAPSRTSFNGVRMTSISRRDYRDSIIMREGPDGCKYSFFQGGEIQTAADGNSDWDAVEAGCVSVCRVYAQPVNPESGLGEMPEFHL